MRKTSGSAGCPLEVRSRGRRPSTRILLRRLTFSNGLLIRLYIDVVLKSTVPPLDSCITVPAAI